MLVRDLLGIDSDIEITGITDDSREVKDGMIFVATHGFNVDHFNYINDAIKNGCIFLVIDRELSFNFPHIVVDNINSYYKVLCIKYYKINLEKLHFIGITGTDGKTTTSTIIKEIIGDSAYLGTNGLTVKEDSYKTNNTTPCIGEFYKYLKIIQDHDVSNVSMEVSSEALLHERISNILFDVVAITNVTGDHFNVHKNFKNYLNCKLKILELVKNDGCIFLNKDDKSLKDIKKDNVYTYGFSKDADYLIENVKYYKRKTIITLKDKDKSIIIHSPLIGKFNVYNVVLAFLIGRFFEIDSDLLLRRIRVLKPIKGRCEFIDFNQNFDIVLDYAHTINGISNILDTFKNYSRIITVTGCAGGRDRSKRRTIGKLVMEKSDITIFTMDDPRFEDVDNIIDEMVGDDSNYIRIIDRKEAIFYALEIARKGDVVLILGKGRDNYMAINDKKIFYSDYDVIKEFYKK